MKIVYTPLHGTGEMLACQMCSCSQDLTLSAVEAQATADPDFSQNLQTQKAKQPLPFAEELGRQVGADVLVATDPDADRVGVEVLQKMVATLTFQVTKSVLSW